MNRNADQKCVRSGIDWTTNASNRSVGKTKSTQNTDSYDEQLEGCIQQGNISMFDFGEDSKTMVSMSSKKANKIFIWRTYHHFDCAVLLAIHAGYTLIYSFRF